MTRRPLRVELRCQMSRGGGAMGATGLCGDFTEMVMDTPDAGTIPVCFTCGDKSALSRRYPTRDEVSAFIASDVMGS